MVAGGAAFGADAPVAAGEPWLQQAKVYYDGLEFDRCLERLEQAGRESASFEVLAEIELYRGLCHFNLGHRTEAERYFGLALQLDRQVQLPPMTSPKIHAVFAEVVKALPSEASPPEAPASQSNQTLANALVNPSPPEEKPSPPYPRVLPWVMGGAAAALAGGGVFFGASAKEHERLANQATYTFTAHQNASAAQGDALKANLAFTGSLLFTGVAAYLLWSSR
ncbi:MAG: hypothetical protein ACOZIN_02400 [Myxococcota bacterium]